MLVIGREFIDFLLLFWKKKKIVGIFFWKKNTARPIGGGDGGAGVAKGCNFN
jgi:hypothetical protein